MFSRIFIFNLFLSSITNLTAQFNSTLKNAFAFGDGVGGNGEINAQCTDSKGNIYIAGFISGAVDMDPSSGETVLVTPSSSTRRLFLAKYTASDSLIWSQIMVSDKTNFVYDLATDASDNIYVVGAYSGTLYPNRQNSTFKLTSVTNNNADGFVLKYSSKGTFIWGKSIGGKSVDNVYTLAIEGNSLYLGGAFSDTADLNPDTTKNNYVYATGSFQDPYLMLWDTSGRFKWGFSMYGSSSPGLLTRLNVHPKGGVLATGHFNNTVDFNPDTTKFELTSAGNLDIFMAQYDTSGKFIWAKRAGGKSEDVCYGARISKDSNIYLTGYFNSTADMDPSSNTHNLISNGNKDAYVAKYNDTGAFDWAISTGSTSTDMSNDIALDDSSNCYITGVYTSTVDFDPSSTASKSLSSSSGDWYIGSYNKSGDFRWVKEISGNKYNVGSRLLTSKTHVKVVGIVRDAVDLNSDSGKLNYTTVSNTTTGALVSLDLDTGRWQNTFVLEGRKGGNDQAQSITKSNDGNTLVAGYFQGSVDMDPTAKKKVLNSTTQQGYITSYDAKRNLNWSVGFSGSGTSLVEDICLTPNGDIIAVGGFTGTVDFDGDTSRYEITANRLTDAFVVKYSKSGKFIWAKTMNGGNDESAYKVLTDSEGNINMVGYFVAIVDFDPDTLSSKTKFDTARNRDVFLVQWDSTGAFNWQFKIGGTSNDFGWSLSVDSKDNIYTTGQFRNATDFDPSAAMQSITPYGGDDVFVAKYSKTGGYLWAQRYGGTGADIGRDIHVVGDTLIFVSGFFQGTADLDPTSTQLSVISKGSDDVFILALDSSGNTRWGKSFGSKNSDKAFAIDVFEGNLFTLGTYSDSMDMHPDTAKTINAERFGLADVFLNVFDLQGNYAGHVVGGSGSADMAMDLAANKSEISIVGSFSNAFDFNPQAGTYFLNAVGGTDAFLWDLQTKIPCDTFIDSLVIVNCDSYKSPSGKVWYKSQNFFDTVIANQGCDSIYFINLTIRITDRDTVYFSTCKSYNDSILRQTFDKSGNYSDTFINRFGCDSIYVLNLTINTGSSSQESISACESYTWSNNGTRYTQSGTYYDTLQTIAGCDSIVTLNLTINTGSSSQESISACESYTWSNTGTRYTQSGTYYDTLQTIAGCDSIVTLSLTINSLDIRIVKKGDTLELESPIELDTYQWLNCDSNDRAIFGANNFWFKPLSSGNYALSGTLESCSDTSRCILISILKSKSLDGMNTAVFPNPSNGNFTITSKSAIISHVDVFNILGAKIDSEDYQVVKYSNTQFSISISCPSDTYILRVVYTNGNEENIQVIKLNDLK